MTTTDRTAALRARRHQPHARQAPARPTDTALTPDQIPAPETTDATGTLNPTERHQLILCEQAMDNLTAATWLAGKALQAIRDRRLYRTTHDTFETYLQERWEISKRAGYHLIEEWPLAERLHHHLGRPATPSHIRALLPLARHSPDTAVSFYTQLRTRTEAEDRRLTAHLITQIVKTVLATARKDTDRQQLAEVITEVTATAPLSPAAPCPDVQNSAHHPPGTSRPARAALPDPPQPGLIGLLEDILHRTITLERDLINAASPTHATEAHTPEAHRLRRTIHLRLTAANRALGLGEGNRVRGKSGG